MERTKITPPRDVTVNFGRSALALGIVLLVALAHAFRLGSHLQDPLYTLYYSFFSDLAIPVAVYFLLCVNDAYIRPLQDWRLKAALVFGAAALAETLQAFGVPLLGQTFDPLDYVMYAAGALLAVLLDRVLFARLLPFWPAGAD